MILLFSQLALAACVPDSAEVWPADGADRTPRNAAVLVRIPGECAPETLVIELDGEPTLSVLRFGYGPSLYAVLDMPELEPGEHELIVRDEAPTFRVRSTFTVVDALAEPPEIPPESGDLVATWYPAKGGDVGLTARLRPRTAELDGTPDAVLVMGAGPWVDRLQRDYVDSTRRGHQLTLWGRMPEPPDEDVCIDLVRLNASSSTLRSTLCAEATREDFGRGCSALSAAPAGLLALLGGLLVIARRRP